MAVKEDMAIVTIRAARAADLAGGRAVGEEGGHSLLGGEQLVDQLEVKGDSLTREKGKADITPCKLPVNFRMFSLNFRLIFIINCR